MKKFREVESAHLGTTTGSRLCPKDQPQQVRMPRVAELSENPWPRRAAAAGAPHTAAVRSRAFGGGIKMRPSGLPVPSELERRRSQSPLKGRPVRAPGLQGMPISGEIL